MKSFLTSAALAAVAIFSLGAPTPASGADDQKAVLITGATTGIGRYAAERLAKAGQQIRRLNRELPVPEASVEVSRAFYPGVTVEIRGMPFRIARTWGADRVIVSPETREVCLASNGGDLSVPLDEAA